MDMDIRISTLLIYIISIYTVSAVMKLQEIFSWNVLDWSYPDEQSKKLAIDVESLIPENAIPFGIEKWKNKLFITVPRRLGGVPATLNYIPLGAPYVPSPKLLPYPSFEGNELGNCNNGLNTVYRVKADKCDRLWVLDTGTFGYDPNITKICPHALYIYDLNNDHRIRKYIFDSEDISASTLITNIALDIGTNCTDAFAYFSDELGYSLIVYSWEENKSWRFTHSYFMPDPLLGTYNISGLVFQWGNEGIYSIALSPINEDGYRTLYFSPLSSHTEFSVSTRILRNETNVKKSFGDFNIVGFRGPGGHSTAKVMDGSGVQLFSLIDQNAIACWNHIAPYEPDKIGIMDKDDINLIFTSDIKIDEDKVVWIISNRMPLFIESILDYSDINFRIFSAPLNTLLEGTVCELPIPVFTNLSLARPKIKPLPYHVGKSKLLVPFPTQKLQIPAGIHNPKFCNTSNVLNFSIVVSSKAEHFIQAPNYENTTELRSTVNDETTPKMIIYVTSPDFNEILKPANKYDKYSNNANVTPEIKNMYSSIQPTTFHAITKFNLTTTPVPGSYINNNQIKKKSNMNYQRFPFTVGSVNRFNPNPPHKSPKTFNYKNVAVFQNSKNTLRPNFEPNKYVNLPTAPIIKNKNNPFLNTTSFSNKTIDTTNEQNAATTPLYDDEDYYETATIVNVAPTVVNYGNELWYIGNVSRLNPNLYINQSVNEDSDVNMRHSVTNNIIPIVVESEYKANKNINPNIKNIKPNKIDKVHYPTRREGPKKYNNNANALIHYVTSPTAFPKRVNFINAAYFNDESINKLDYKPFRPVSSISKRITNTNIYSTLISKTSNNIGGKATYSIKVNVLYPSTTVNTIDRYHRVYKMIRTM